MSILIDASSSHFFQNFQIIQLIAYLIIRGGSRTAGTSKMEHFVIIVNGWKPLTIITKRSILDVTAVLDPPLIIFFFAPNIHVLLIYHNNFQFCFNNIFYFHSLLTIFILKGSIGTILILNFGCANPP